MLPTSVSAGACAAELPETRVAAGTWESPGSPQPGASSFPSLALQPRSSPSQKNNLENHTPKHARGHRGAHPHPPPYGQCIASLSGLSHHKTAIGPPQKAPAKTHRLSREPPQPSRQQPGEKNGSFTRHLKYFQTSPSPRRWRERPFPKARGLPQPCPGIALPRPAGRGAPAEAPGLPEPSPRYRYEGSGGAPSPPSGTLPPSSRGLQLSRERTR